VGPVNRTPPGDSPDLLHLPLASPAPPDSPTRAVPRSPRRDGAQGGLAGDVRARMDVELPQDVGDVGRDGPPRQQQLGGDLWVGQSALRQCGDLGLARREAVPAAPCLPVFRARAAADAMGAERGPQPGDLSLFPLS
jgi:hypothetical protein